MNKTVHFNIFRISNMPRVPITQSGQLGQYVFSVTIAHMG